MSARRHKGNMIPVYEIKRGEFGYGMFSRYDIGVGTPIIEESPLIVYKTGHTPNDIRKLASALEDKKRTSYYRLSRYRVTRNIAFDISQSNAIDIGDGDSAVFFCLSKINHSCAYNSTIEWNPRNTKAVLVASRRICAGEEIFISYTNPFITRKERRDYLSCRYGFICKCHICTSTSFRSRDACMVSIAKHIDVISATLNIEYIDKGDVYEYTDPVKLLEMLMDVIYKLIQMDLYSICHRHYYTGFMICVAHQDYIAAKKWADLALSSYIFNKVGACYNTYSLHSRRPRKYHPPLYRESLSKLPYPIHYIR